MNELTRITRNDVFTNTLIIADNIGYAHKDITIHLTKHRGRFEKMGGIYYVHSVTNKRGRQYKPIELNEQQAIFLMTLLDNSETVLDFKMELAQSFVTMRKLLLEKQTIDWQRTRQQSKQVRLQETDAIKGLIGYAKAQGSENADKLYVVYSNLVKGLSENVGRDAADGEQLTRLIMFEKTLFGIINDGMIKNDHYKAIYKRAKSQIMELQRLWSIPGLSAKQ
jgi:phage regulator Rha-like protein